MRRRVGIGLVGAWLLAVAWISACSSDELPLANPTPPSLPEASANTTNTAISDASANDDAANADANGDAEVDASSDFDATDDVDGGLPILKRVSGVIDFNGPLRGAKVELLRPTQESLVTDETGNFFFYAPLGATAVFKATPPADAGAYPMIRGVVVEDSIRIRVFYLQAKSDLDGLPGLGITLDESKAVVEVDFRNSEVGGYGVTMTGANGATIAPGFGIASGESGPEKSLTTLRGGDGSTMLYGNVPPGSDVSFAPTVPADAGRPAIPCDAQQLPLQPGVVTWFDFECGVANCQ